MKSFALSSLLVVVAACSSSATSNDVTPGSDGVNDVLAACQLRAQWANATSTACTTCIGLAESPRCACTDQDYAGKCATQQASMRDEPTCDGVSTCISACATTDCACVDACYAQKPACRTKASAADGCLADVCASYCR